MTTRKETSSPDILYTDEFYQQQSAGSSSSADYIVPIVLSTTHARSVVDVGCGVGTWCEKFLEHGVRDVLGLDGDYINRELLRIPQPCFLPSDLRRPVRLDRHFDLAVCLEVAEHLPESRAQGLVDDLTRLAPVVLFSAAIPGQGGTDHINEQYLGYWAEHFSAHGYVLLDVIRPMIWNEEACDWWYRQNAVLFAEASHPASSASRRDSTVDIIHPRLYAAKLAAIDRPVTLSYLVRSIPSCLRRSIRSRIAAARKTLPSAS